MLIGDLDYPIEQAVLFFILILSLIFNYYLYHRGQGNYSIKYQLMRNQQFFRQHKIITNIIEGLYKFFFTLPFLLLIVLSILAAIRNINNLSPILINGLIILLMLYPTKRQHYYYKLLLIFALGFGSQLSSFFIYEKNGQQAYFILSFAFYTGNIIFFYLAMLSIENIYWEISTGIQKNKQIFSQVNQVWAYDITKIPKVFDGGLYGFFCKNPYKPHLYLILYGISLLFLITYSLLVYFILNLKLGFVGLVSAFIYDIFLQIFNTLDNTVKSNRSLFIVLVISRFLSFVFGLQNWLLGYCVLYFFVSVFIGFIIIDKHFPMSVNTVKRNNSNKSKFINAFKTPQFVLFLLTLQIIIMLLVQAYALTQKDPTVIYNNITIPIWQWGLLTLACAWVLIIYSLSIRVLNRHKNKIYNLVQYYFGVGFITEYHLYLSMTYILLIGIGLYGYFYLQDKVLLSSCIFLPLIYITLSAFYVTWRTNQYMILAHTEQYNRIMQKKVKTHNTRNQIMSKMNTQRKKKLMLNSIIKRAPISQFSLRSFNKFNDKDDAEYNQPQLFATGQLSGGNLKPLQFRNDNIKQTQNDNNNDKNNNSKDNQIKFQQKQYIPLIDWRDPDRNVSITEIWSCLTPNDKKIIFITIIFLILSIGYMLLSMLWAQSKFGISVMVCVVSYLTLIPYFKYYQTKNQVLIYEIIMNWFGFGLGIGYWSAFISQKVGPLCFSLIYILLALYMLIQCYRTQFSIKVMISPALQILCCIAFVQVTVALYLSVTIAVLFAIVFFVLAVLQGPLYCFLTMQYVPKYVYVISTVLIGGVIILTSVLGYIYDKLSSFAIFTIVMLFIFFSLYFAALGLLIHKYLNMQQIPNVYSAYGQPHYKFDSGKQMLKSNTSHIILFSFSMTAILIYSVIVSVFFQMKQWAVYGLSFFLLMEFFVSMQISMSSYLFIGRYQKQKLLTDQIIKQSLIKLKNHYLVDQIQGEDSPIYEKQLLEAKQIAKRQGGAQNWKKVVEYHDLYIKNIHQQQKFLFFWIALIMFNLMAKKKQKVSETLAQLKSIEMQLNQSGVILNTLSQNLKPNEKYEKVLKQIQNLNHVDYVLYQQILQNHRLQQKQKNKLIQQAHQKQLQQQNRRDQQIYEQLKRKQDVSEKQQIAKFKKLTKNLGRKNFYIDQQFPADQSIVGNELNNQVKKWRRPSERQMLYKDGISVDDAKQGAIGDCYLISSFAVLGQKNIFQAFGQDLNGNQIWRNQKGAYMVRFYKFSKEVYIIIDDMLPINQNQQWAFAKSQQSSQIWPCILEKAYAKMYGGYDKIVSGKCHQVFAEFTNGFPYQIIIEDYKSNPFGLWNQIVSSKKNGYLLGAGSPANIKGDKAKSKRNIVQGHAYAILDARQVEEYRLIKLKNPHGSQGMEWNGDFSDNSDQMTPNRMKFLQHTKSKDGIFWMPLQDFIIQFRSVYICAVFDDRWIKLKTINGQWTQKNSFGTPNNLQAYKNPHYGIRVTKKSSLFVSLSQQSINALKGKNFIFMKALKNEGKRITIQSLKSTENAIGKQKRPTDAATISLQLQLQASQYPYVFSLMVGSAKAGDTGKYILQAYCDDKNASIIQDSQFDNKKI